MNLNLNFVVYQLLILLNLLKFKYALECEFKTDITTGYTCFLMQTKIETKLKHENDKNDSSVETIIHIKESSDSNKTNQFELQFCQRFNNLLMIEIVGVKLFDNNLFKNCKKLNIISIRDTEIAEISSNFLFENYGLICLILDNNKISSLPETIFINQKNLKILHLSNNQIENLPQNIFKTLTYLQELWLDGNNIQNLHPAWFEYLINLELLILENNKITNLPKHIFHFLRNIKEINLSDNKLSVLHSDSFGICKNLSNIFVQNNQITAIDERIFSKTNEMKIDLLNNNCSSDEISVITAKEDLETCFMNYKPRDIDIRSCEYLKQFSNLM